MWIICLQKSWALPVGCLCCLLCFSIDCCVLNRLSQSLPRIWWGQPFLAGKQVILLPEIVSVYSFIYLVIPSPCFVIKEAPIDSSGLQSTVPINICVCISISESVSRKTLRSWQIFSFRVWTLNNVCMCIIQYNYLWFPSMINPFSMFVYILYVCTLFGF